MGSINGQKHNPYILGKYAHVNKNDVVFTPDWLAKKICELFDIDGAVLEPCKGEGVFMQYLPDDADWCEITEGRNFYDYKKKVDWIVTNPPYSDFNRFLDHAFELADNVVLLVPVAKIFKSMGTIRQVEMYGGIAEIHMLPASAAGFPFGFPCGVFYFKRNHNIMDGGTQMHLLEIPAQKNLNQVQLTDLELDKPLDNTDTANPPQSDLTKGSKT